MYTLKQFLFVVLVQKHGLQTLGSREASRESSHGVASSGFVNGQPLVHGRPGFDTHRSAFINTAAELPAQMPGKDTNSYPKVEVLFSPANYVVADT